MRSILALVLLFIFISLDHVYGGDIYVAGDDSTKLMNWYNKDPELDKVQGVSTERAYTELLKDKTAVPVVVAIIDSGVDIEHEDLKEVIWVNEDEIPDTSDDFTHSILPILWSEQVKFSIPTLSNTVFFKSS